MDGLSVDEADVDGDVAVATMHATPTLQGPDGILQGGFAAGALELAARAAAEAMAGVEPGSTAIPAATMLEARLHKPTPTGADVTALVVAGEDATFEVRTVLSDIDDHADFGEEEVGADVLVSGVVELAGHGPQPILDDLVELALVDDLPRPVPLELASGCFVCGVHHPDGLHLFPAWVDGSSVVQEWVPDDRVASDEGGFVDPAAVAAVLDCPTVWTARDHMAAHGFGGALLGGFTVAWFSRVPLGETLRIAALLESGEGRKMRAIAALVGMDGYVHAAASSFQIGIETWPGAADSKPMPAFGVGPW